MLITKAEAARQLKISRNAVQKWETQPEQPAFFVIENNKTMIDTNHPEWINKLNAPKWTKKNKSISNGAIKRDKMNKAFRESEDEDDYSSVKGKEGGRFFNGALRQAILKRDHFRCVQCGKTPVDGVMLEVDHIIEFEDGGKTTFDNGQTLCKDCNKGKHQLKVLDDNNGFISQMDFAKRIGIHRNTLTNLLDKGIIEKDQTTGFICYETELEKYKQYSGGYSSPIVTPEFEDLTRQAAIAEMQDTIYAAEIKKQKAEQEKLKTLEQKKDLANIDLLIHFFSFAENIIQRWYRRPHELSPQLSALYLAGEEKKAEQLLLKELEGIIKETQKELIKTLEEEGLRINEYN